MDKGKKYLKKGKKLLSGPRKRYDVAFFKLSIFNSDLGKSYELWKKIKRDFYILPIKNRLIGWFYSEVGFLHFLLGDIEQAESYFNRINLYVFKASDLYYLLDALTLLAIFYIFTFRFQKAEEVLNIFAEKFSHSPNDSGFFDTIKAMLHIFSVNESQEFEKLKHEIQVLSLSTGNSRALQENLEILKSDCNNSKNGNELLEKLLDHMMTWIPQNIIITAFIYQIKYKIEEKMGNYWKARDYLFKSLEILKISVSPKNTQVKRIERKIHEIEEIIKLEKEK